MSAVAEIKAAIEKLQPEEFVELAAWVEARRAVATKEDDFQDAMTKVFKHHTPLLRKLAQ